MLNEPSFVHLQTPEQTLTLQEYFVPPNELEAFLAALRAIVPRHALPLLSVVIRSIQRDETTFLPYADQDVLSLAIMFRQARTAADDA